MFNSHPLGPFVRRFLLENVVADRNLSLNTQKSYRDAIRLLLRFIAERYGINPTRLTVEDVNAEVVRHFLAYLEKERGSSLATGNQRLTAIRSLFHFISQCVPELVDLATRSRRCLCVRLFLRRLLISKKKRWTLYLQCRIVAVPRAKGITRCSSSSITPALAPMKPPI